MVNAPTSAEELLRRYAEGNLDFRGTRLPGANLHGVRLSYANLRKADLSRADLCGADLSWTDLTGADLSLAKLEGARLNVAQLRVADLRGADLRGADFSGASLNQADLNGTVIEGAQLKGTILARVNLSATLGLGAVQHDGPSSIDTHTLSLCGWQLPLEFLRGCGLQEWEIESARLYNPDLSPTQTSEIQYKVHELRHQGTVLFFSVFISYSHADMAFARRLHDALQAKGIRCWRDEKQLLPGDKMHEQITQGIRHWDKVLLLASDSSLKSWWVKNEIETIFAKERKLSKERDGANVCALVPLNLDGALFRWDDGYREQVTSRMAADFKGWDSPGFDFDGAVDGVIRALRADGGGRESPPPPRL